MEEDDIPLSKERIPLYGICQRTLPQCLCLLRRSRREMICRRDGTHLGIEMGEIRLRICRSRIRIAIKEWIGKMGAPNLRRAGEVNFVSLIIERIDILLKRLLPLDLHRLRHNMCPIGMKRIIDACGNLICRSRIAVFRHPKIAARKHGTQQNKHRKTEPSLHIRTSHILPAARTNCSQISAYAASTSQTYVRASVSGACARIVRRFVRREARVSGADTSVDAICT